VCRAGSPELTPKKLLPIYGQGGKAPGGYAEN
jgi:hypothetical protein